MSDDQNNKEGIDLSGSLKDSSSGVKFKGEQQYTRSYYPGTSKIIQWVIKYSGGLIKDERQAQYAILGFTVLAIIIFLIVAFGGGPEIPPPSPTPFRESNL